MKKRINRRDFLKKFGIGIAGGSLLLLSPLSGFAETSRSKELQAFSKESGYNLKLLELRRLITELQIDIKKDKVLYAEGSRAGKNVGYIASGLHEKQRKFRHYQIAYSEMLGRKRNEIESSNDTNQPDELLISRIKSQFT